MIVESPGRTALSVNNVCDSRLTMSGVFGIGKMTAMMTVLVWAFVCGTHVTMADEQLEALEERAFREASALAASSIVRIQTVGGLDVIGKMLTSSGPTTGVIVGAEGWIITSSFNFASKPASILVTTPDGRRHPTKQVATDQARMLTLLKIDADGLTPLAAVPREELRVGQWSIALGQTFDQPFPNVSVGIVSAVDRIWGRALQTDAKVSPANYGGPLIDIHGRGMGVLVPLSPSETGETAGVEWYDSGIGFAVPLEDVYAVLEQLKTGEDLKPGRMGVVFQGRNAISGAAVIQRVRPGSPADDAGLAVGDQIIAADGRPVERVPHLRHLLGRKYAGEELTLKVKRGDETLDKQLTLAAELTAYERPLLGIAPIRTALDQTAIDEKPTVGVVVRVVLPESPAESAGLKKGDRILKVNGADIVDAEALENVVLQQNSGDVIAMTIQRGDENTDVEVTLAVMTGETPDSLTTAVIPRPEAVPDDAPETGRLTGMLGGDGDQERSYWAFVPSDYNQSYGYGLVVWLHPAGDVMQAETLKAWRSHCSRRGLILIAPQTTEPSGWSPTDLDFVSDLIEEFQERYEIDSRRVAILAMGNASEMAATTAFRERQTVRGLALINTPLRLPPPEADPDLSLHFHFSFAEDGPTADAIEQSTAALRKLKHPVTASRVAGEKVDLTTESVERIAIWVDLLDRI